jgi:hypothetical protein
MELYKNQQEGAGKREGAVKNFLRIATLMGALGGAYGTIEKAQATSFGELPTEATSDLDAQEDAGESMENTVEAILQKAIDGKAVAENEAAAVRFAWEEMSEYLPRDVTSGEYGQTMEEMLSKLEEIAQTATKDSELKNEFTALSEKLTDLEKEPEVMALKDGVDPFIEEDTNAVEYSAEDK